MEASTNNQDLYTTLLSTQLSTFETLQHQVHATTISMIEHQHELVRTEINDVLTSTRAELARELGETQQSYRGLEATLVNKIDELNTTIARLERASDAAERGMLVKLVGAQFVLILCLIAYIAVLKGAITRSNPAFNGASAGLRWYGEQENMIGVNGLMHNGHRQQICCRAC